MFFLLTLGIIGFAVVLSVPLGMWMNRILCPDSESKLDIILHEIIGRMSKTDQNWKQYSVSLLLFNGVMFAFAYCVLSYQHVLPFNPDGGGKLAPDLVFHTVASFVTNTNLQHYSGESVLSYGSQIFGLMWLQFVSAATGMAALTAVCRWIGSIEQTNNFYMDLARSAICVLLPVATITAVALVICGIPMTFQGMAVAQTLEGSEQMIARGPVAAFVAIKQIGTNGGGFFGTNSAHPFENVSFYSNLIESVSLLVIPMACVWFFGHVTRRRKDAMVIFFVMVLFLCIKMGLAVSLEQYPSAALNGLPVMESGNLEGKELRFGLTTCPIWATFTTCTSNGSVNSMNSSLNPLTSLILLCGMWNNITFGGTGVGLLGLFSYIIIAVFISGMMVGRTPEYHGKKVETHEMKYAIGILLLHPLCILCGVAIFCMVPEWGRDTALNSGFHGFTEILYEITSASANNGSGFEGLKDNTIPWNIGTGIIMLTGRFLPIVLTFAIAGSLASKQTIPETVGTLKTDTVFFRAVLAAVVILIGSLLFLPVAVLGPVAEYLTTSGLF